MIVKFFKKNILIENKVFQNDESSLIKQETWKSINSLSKMFVNSNDYIPFPPGLYMELGRWPSFLSLIWGMFSVLHIKLFQNDISSLNKRTEAIIDPFLNDINIIKKPDNIIDINIPIHILTIVVIPKMIIVGTMLKKSLS